MSSYLQNRVVVGAKRKVMSARANRAAGKVGKPKNVPRISPRRPGGKGIKLTDSPVTKRRFVAAQASPRPVAVVRIDGLEVDVAHGNAPEAALAQVDARQPAALERAAVSPLTPEVEIDDVDEVVIEVRLESHRKEGLELGGSSGGVRHPSPESPPARP